MKERITYGLGRWCTGTGLLPLLPFFAGVPPDRNDWHRDVAICQRRDVARLSFLTYSRMRGATLKPSATHLQFEHATVTTPQFLQEIVFQ